MKKNEKIKRALPAGDKNATDSAEITKRIALSLRVGGGLNLRLIGAAALYVLVCAVLIWPQFRGVPLREGDVSPVTVRAPKTMMYPDDRATQALQEKARKSAEEIYTVFPEKIEEDVRSVFAAVLQVRDYPEDSPARIAAEEDLMDNKFLSADTVAALMEADKQELSEVLYRKTDSVVKRLLAGGEELTGSRVRGLESEVERLAIESGIKRSQVPIAIDIIKSLVGVNSMMDREATEKNREAAAAAVKPVLRKSIRSTVIVKKGAIITRGKREALSSLGLLPRRVQWGGIAGGALLILFVFAVIATYLKNFSHRVYRDEKKMTIFYLLILFAALWALFVSQMSAGAVWFSPNSLGIATGVLAVLTCIILDPQTALVVTPLVALCLTIVLKFDIGAFLVALMAGLVGCFGTVRRQDLDSIMKAGVMISLTGMAVITIVTLFNFETWQQAALDILVFGSINGLATAILAAGILPLLERGFNIITPHRLLELSNPEQPLLKQLMINAPGTYHHCIFVGNLAENAAELVGADPLLVRIACYYHDIGKLKRPYFFVENQLTGHSLLSDLSPTLGSLVINSHVKDGIEMLREHRVPEGIVRIAAEHHGTCLISFFYQQARAQAKDPDDVSEERFRYPGPKPGTLESAIVMLADGCEAAVRALKEYTAHTIESQVNSVVKSRIVDGQFDECDITLLQLDTIRKAFIRILLGVYHARIEYPELDDLKKKAEGENGRDAAGGGRGAGA